MNKVFCFSIQIFLISSLSHADAVLSRSAFIHGGLIGSSLISKIASLIHGGFENSRKIEQEAETRGKLLDSIWKPEKSYEKVRQERTQRIRELKRKISEVHPYFLLSEEESLEDMLAELSELLEKPAELDFDDEKSVQFDSNLELVKQPSVVGNIVVPGMWMAGPKKNDGDRQGKKSEPKKESGDAQPQGATAVPSDASSLAPVVAVGIGVTVQTPTGPLSIPIPLELQPIFFNLHSENLALKVENQQLRSRCTDLGQRLQSETDRSASYERDLQRVLNEYKDSEKRCKNLESEYEVLREEIARLKAENTALRKENEDLKRVLLETRNRLSKTENRLTKTEERLAGMESFMEIAEAFNYVNAGIRKAFKKPTGPGFVAVANKAREGKLTEAESAVWDGFVKAHPNANDQGVIDLVAFVLEGRVVRAHPSVRHLSREQLFADLKQIVPDEDDAVIRKAIDLIWSFPV